MACIPSGAAAAKNSRYFLLRTAPETRTTSFLDENYVFDQNMTEYNPAPSPSGHPLLSE